MSTIRSSSRRHAVALASGIWLVLLFAAAAERRVLTQSTLALIAANSSASLWKPNGFDVERE
jgi:hypothetical protein